MRIMNYNNVMFAFFDFSESKISFLLDYSAVMVLVAEIAFWVQTGLLKIVGSNRQKKNGGKERS